MFSTQEPEFCLNLFNERMQKLRLLSNDVALLDCLEKYAPID